MARRRSAKKAMEESMIKPRRGRGRPRGSMNKRRKSKMSMSKRRRGRGRPRSSKRSAKRTSRGSKRRREGSSTPIKDVQDFIDGKVDIFNTKKDIVKFLTKVSTKRRASRGRPRGSKSRTSMRKRRRGRGRPRGSKKKFGRMPDLFEMEGPYNPVMSNPVVVKTNAPATTAPAMVSVSDAPVSAYGRRRRMRGVTGRRFGKQFGPGYPGNGAFPNAVGSPYFGSLEPFQNPPEFWMPTTQGAYQSPEMLVDFPKN